MKTDSLALMLLTIALAQTIFGQNKATPSNSPASMPVRVYVSVSASPMIESVIESGLLRRLRAFKDVEIVHSVNPTSSPVSDVSAVYVQAIETENQDKHQTGHAIAVVFTETDPLDVVKALAYEDQKKIAGLIVDRLRGRTVYKGQSIYTCGLNDLNRVLDKMVADIDTYILEPVR
jgi:hypothetical protein